MRLRFGEVTACTSTEPYTATVILDGAEVEVGSPGFIEAGTIAAIGQEGRRLTILTPRSTEPPAQGPLWAQVVYFRPSGGLTADELRDPKELPWTLLHTWDVYHNYTAGSGWIIQTFVSPTQEKLSPRAVLSLFHDGDPLNTSDQPIFYHRAGPLGVEPFGDVVGTDQQSGFGGAYAQVQAPASGLLKVVTWAAANDGLFNGNPSNGTGTAVTSHAQALPYPAQMQALRLGFGVAESPTMGEWTYAQSSNPGRPAYVGLSLLEGSPTP